MRNSYYDNPNWFVEMMKEEIEFYDKFPKLAQLTINEIAKRLRGKENGKNLSKRKTYL